MTLIELDCVTSFKVFEPVAGVSTGRVRRPGGVDGAGEA